MSSRHLYPSNWPVIRAAVVTRDQGVCQKCKILPGQHVHHKIPVSRGGGHELTNLVLLCEGCHVLTRQVARRAHYSKFKCRHGLRLVSPNKKKGKALVLDAVCRIPECVEKYEIPEDLL